MDVNVFQCIICGTVQDILFKLKYTRPVHRGGAGGANAHPS